MPILCDQIMRKALERTMTDPEIDKYLQDVQAMFEAIGKSAKNPQDAALEAQARALKKKVEAAANARARLLQGQRLEANLALVSGDYRGVEIDGLESLLTGTQSAKAASHFSVDRLAKSFEEYYSGCLITRVNKLGDGYLKQLKSGRIDQDIARALWLIERPKDYRGSPEAWKIAEVIHDMGEECRLEQNKQGANILKLAGYIVTQTHDQAKIWKAGPDAWKDFIKTRLDWSRTADGRFDPVRDPAQCDAFLQDLWDSFSSGIHEKAQDVIANPLASPGTTGTTAAKLSKNRVLHFLDGDAWFEYNQKFGLGNIREAVLNGFRKAAQNTSLMRILGPSPKAGFENLVRLVERNLKGQGRHGDCQKLAGKKSWLDALYKTVDGSSRIAGNPTLASIGSNVRAWNNMTKLGGVLISSITDVPSFGAEFAYHGEGFLRSMADGLKLVTQGRGSLESQEILSDCGVFFDSINSELCARFGGDFSGSLQYMSNVFFKINGLSLWTDAWKRAAGLMLSHNLARYAKNAWADLAHQNRRLLGIYGIGEDAWNLLRKGRTRALDGRDYLTPQIAQDISEADIEAIFKREGKAFSKGQAQAYRDDLEARIRTLIRVRVSYAVLEPDAKTRAYLYGGTAPGTGMGEIARFVLQFKSFPAAFILKMLGRELLGREAAGVMGGLKNVFIKDQFGERSNFARMFLMMTLFGYAAMTCKQLVAGKTPHDPKKWETWTAAAIQGGGIGILGDFLFGEKSRMGSSFLSTLAGPTLSQMEAFYNLKANIMAGQDVSSESIRLALSLTPGNNLFYMRTAFDYLVGYNLYEMLNPGYIARTRRRIKKENGQTFWLEPKKW